jgi:hypothetical protein
MLFTSQELNTRLIVCIVSIVCVCIILITNSNGDVNEVHTYTQTNDAKCNSDVKYHDEQSVEWVSQQIHSPSRVPYRLKDATKMDYSQSKQTTRLIYKYFYRARNGIFLEVCTRI